MNMAMFSPVNTAKDFPESCQDHWHANLCLKFSVNEKKTIISHRLHKGPLQVQRPFYPEKDGTCHVYILHPPSGVVAGDVLNIDVEALKNTRVLLTTPGATKYYLSKSESLAAIQQQTLKIEEGSVLEWFPQETILFDGARVELVTRVELKNHSHFSGWEIICLGRPASNDFFTQGYCRQRFELYLNNKPLWFDRCRFQGGDEILKASWGMNGKTVTGTFVCTVTEDDLAEEIRNEFCAYDEQVEFSVTQINNILICRYLGQHAEQAKSYFQIAWDIVRQKIHFKKSCSPRVWNT